MAKAGKKGKADLQETVEAAIDLLREDPARMKTLLRNSADLATEVAGVLSDAKQDDAASKVKTVATSLKGAAILPAGMAAALLRKALTKVLDAAG
jgi:hypothetical protein